jgi:hypothetical protein
MHFFNGFEVSIQFCIFETHIELLKTKKLLAHISSFCNTVKPKSYKMAARKQKPLL